MDEKIKQKLRTLFIKALIEQKEILQEEAIQAAKNQISLDINSIHGEKHCKNI